jgi:hypothetical protein
MGEKVEGDIRSWHHLHIDSGHLFGIKDDVEESKGKKGWSECVGGLRASPKSERKRD